MNNPKEEDIPSIAALRAKAGSALESRLFGFMENDGSKLVSDKVYGIFLVEQGARLYGVDTLYGGRRSAKLDGAPKAAGLGLEEARKALGKACAERSRKGYSEFCDCDALAESKSEEGFALTQSMAAKLPAYINDGFARPGRARCWVGPESFMSKELGELGSDCVQSEIAMFPTAMIRQVALEAAAILDKTALRSLGVYDPGEPMGVLLGIWEGDAHGFSMVGTFICGGEELEAWPIQDLAEKHGGFLIANGGDDNYPGGGFEALLEIWKGLAPSEGPKRMEVAQAVAALAGWVEAQELECALEEAPELGDLIGQARAYGEALGIGAAAREVPHGKRTAAI